MATVTTDIKADFDYYLDNREDLVTNYLGKFIVIKDCNVIGSYDSEQEAITATLPKYKLGTFIVQRVLEDDSNTVQYFHSRVAAL